MFPSVETARAPERGLAPGAGHDAVEMRIAHGEAVTFALLGEKEPGGAVLGRQTEELGRDGETGSEQEKGVTLPQSASP